MKVVGIKSVISKKDGVHYRELHTVSEDRFVNGLRADTFFVREDLIDHLDALVLDVDIKVFYNRFGRVESVSVII